MTTNVVSLTDRIIFTEPNTYTQVQSSTHGSSDPFPFLETVVKKHLRTNQDGLYISDAGSVSIISSITARVSRSAIEVIAQYTPYARVSRVAVEIIRANSTSTATDSPVFSGQTGGGAGYAAVSTLNYFVRAAFVPSPGWAEVTSMGWSWAQLTQFTWEELAAGPLDLQDVFAVRIERQEANVFSDLRVGRCDLILDNQNGVYSPEIRTQNIMRPNGRLTVKAQTDTGSIYGLFSGFVDSVGIDPKLGPQHTQVTASDRGKFLKRTVSIGIQANTRPNSLVSVILDSVGWPAAERYIDPSMDDLISGAYLDDESGGAALSDVIRSGAHRAYVNGRGFLQMWDRNFDVLGKVPVSSYSNSFLDLTYTLDDTRLINDARISAQPRVPTTEISTVAWIDQAISIPTSRFATFSIDYIDPETREQRTPVQSIVTPVAGLDWVFSADETGSATNLTSGVTMTFSAGALTALVTVRNNNPVSGYLSRFQIRGAPLRRGPVYQSRSQVSSSQDIYDRYAFELQNDLIRDVLHTQDYATYLGLQYKDPLPAPSFQQKNYLPDILALDILSVVTIVESNTGLNRVAIIESVEHTITTQRGVEHTAIFNARPTIDKPYLLLNADPEGRLDSTRVLGF